MINKVHSSYRKSIFLATFTRDELLDQCINSILNADGFREYFFFVIRQGDHCATHQVLEKYRHAIDKIILVPGIKDDPIANINHNRVTGYRYAFDVLGSDFAIAVEDDVIIAKDSLRFVETMIEKYKLDPKFGCVNLMSTGIQSDQNSSYSKFRAPLIGNGSAITQYNWRKLESQRLLNRLKREPFDGAIEDWMKCRYSIFPNRSRILDFGWSGTHSSDPNDLHFEINRKSWIGDCEVKKQYHWEQAPRNLREDWKPYKRTDNLRYTLRKIALDLNRNYIGHEVITACRKLLGFNRIQR